MGKVLLGLVDLGRMTSFPALAVTPLLPCIRRSGRSTRDHVV